MDADLVPKLNILETPGASGKFKLTVSETNVLHTPGVVCWSLTEICELYVVAFNLG